jgi:hypothetical protein
MGRLLKAACLAVALASSAAASASLEPHESSERGVTVTVTPLDVDPGNKVWQFRVSLETHTQELGDDLVASSVLLDERGAKRHAIAWKGPGPGGHHRSGVLSFEAIEPLPGMIELLIWRAEEAAPRAFRWNLR